MELWSVIDAVVARCNAEECELFLYQRMRTTSGSIVSLDSHLKAIEAAAAEIFPHFTLPDKAAVERDCNRLLCSYGVSTTAVQIVELRVWQSGRYRLHIVENSPYKGFELRVMRPKARVVRGFEQVVALPSSAALAAVELMRHTARRDGYDTAVVVDSENRVISVDGALPVTVHGTQITVCNSEYYPYNAMIVAALAKLSHYTLVSYPIRLEHLYSADEIFYADHRGITALGSIDDHYLTDSTAYAAQLK